MKKNTSPTELLLAKLERPVHISYISQYILRLPINETQTRIKSLIESGLLMESEYGKEYYVRTKRNG
jgi:hypothetical protein